MMTKAFASNGAQVYIIGRRKEKLDEVAQLSPNITPLVGDVTSPDSLREVTDQIRRKTGFVNLLCCNSGYMPPPMGLNAAEMSVEEYAAKALKQRPEDWHSTFATNSSSISFSVMAFLTLLDAGNKKGNVPGRTSQVLVTSSIAGYLRNPATFGAYPASKAAATHMVKHLAGTLTPYSIRVNAIAPGLFPSELAAGLIAGMGGSEGDWSAEGSIAKNVIPAQRLGKTEDVAGTVLYMASAAGAYMNGNINVLDGGRITQLNGTY